MLTDYKGHHHYTVKTCYQYNCLHLNIQTQYPTGGLKGQVCSWPTSWRPPSTDWLSL